MNFRNHNFSFKMFARDPQEAQTIEEIIHYFKAGAHPRYQRGDILSGMASQGAKFDPDKEGDDFSDSQLIEILDKSKWIKNKFKERADYPALNGLTMAMRFAKPAA